MIRVLVLMEYGYVIQGRSQNVASALIKGMKQYCTVAAVTSNQLHAITHDQRVLYS